METKKLSRRIQQVQPSATIAITARAAQMRSEGLDIISFGAGEPDFPTPPFIQQAAIEAMTEGDTRYTPRRGKDLQKAIAKKLKDENQIQVDPGQIVVTFGAKQALFDAFQVLLDDGDSVLIPAPYWNSYPEMVRLAGGKPVPLPAGSEQGFKVTPEQILAANDEAGGAKILLINSPSNPTGVTYTPEELEQIAQAVLKTDLIVFSDECYEKLIYGDTRFVSFASLDPKLPQRTVTFNAASKTYAMTGWRIGWAAGPAEIIEAIRRIKSHENTNPPGFCQAGALAAYSLLEAPATAETMRTEFAKRAKRMSERLNSIDGVSCIEPTGAFYCFPDISAHYGRTIGERKISGSLDLAAAALESVQVALVPGIAFGEDRCVRLSFATSLEQIDQGLDRLRDLLG